MFIKRFTLFTLFRFPIRIDLSWFFIVIIVTWSLAADFFPKNYDNLTPPTYWTMGVVGTLALFTSVVLHELGHALVARHYGLEIKGITLFIFGGVAEMSDEPPSAKSEFMVAIAGPIVSIALAGVFYITNLAPWPPAVSGVLSYLTLINGLLVAFNMVPAFPLDGGRVLRSILWRVKGNLTWATRIASKIGSGFGLVMIFLGILLLLTGNFVGAIWWAILGMFLRAAAQMSYQQVIIRRALEGELVSRFMKSDPVTVPSSISIESLVEDYIYKHHFKMYPVVESGRLAGCVTTRQIKKLPRQEWLTRTAGSIIERCSPENTIQIDADITEAFAKMNRQKASRLMVLDKDHLVGVISLKDLMDFLSLKIELG